MPGHRDELFAKGSLAILYVALQKEVDIPTATTHDHFIHALAAGLP